MNKQVLIITFSVNSLVVQMLSLKKLKEVKLIEVRGTKKEFAFILKEEVGKRYDYIFCDVQLYTKDLENIINSVKWSFNMDTKIITHKESDLTESSFFQILKNCIEGNKALFYRPKGHTGKILSDLLKSLNISFITIFTEDDEPRLFEHDSLFPIKGFRRIKEQLELRKRA